MDKSILQDLFNEFELDWEDPFTEDLVRYVSIAIVKFYEGVEKEKSPSIAFNEFVDAWDFYNFIPETSQTKSRKLMDACWGMWTDVLKSKTDGFCERCIAAVQEGADHDPFLVDLCCELNEAIFAVCGRIPEAQRLFEVAHDAALHGTTLSNACIAQLFILCARVWYNCFGYPCSEEEKLLSEGIKHHMLAKAQGKVPKTELYSLHIATAIYDATFVQLKNGVTREEITDQVLEAYALLSSLSSPTALKEIEDLNQMTGIPYQDRTRGRRFESILMPDENNGLPN